MLGKMWGRVPGEGVYGKGCDTQFLPELLLY